MPANNVRTLQKRPGLVRSLRLTRVLATRVPPPWVSGKTPAPPSRSPPAWKLQGRRGAAQNCVATRTSWLETVRAGVVPAQVWLLTSEVVLHKFKFSEAPPRTLTPDLGGNPR